MAGWVTGQLAEYAARTRFEDYPQEAIVKAKTLVLDNIGCMLGGSQGVLGRTMLNTIRRMRGVQEATLVGGGARVPAIQAALVNGTTANALDFDDGMRGIGHPGSSVIPSALAVGEWQHASGRDVITAILTGYDVGNRIGVAIQPSRERYENVWGVGTWQTFNAVAAAAKVLKLDLQQTLDAYGVAGATAPLPNTQKWGWDVEERPVHWVKEPTGWPCWTGTTAAVLAEQGFIGNHHILDGDDGFWIMAGSDRCDFDRMTQDLGTDYEVDHVTIKPYPCCRWQHAALDAIGELMQRHELRARDVQDVIVHSVSWLKRQEVHHPLNVVDAQFSMPYSAAMVLLGIDPGPAWYTEERVADEAVQRLSERVKVTPDAELDRVLHEESRTSARVQIITKGGQDLSAFVSVARGDPQRPLSQHEVEQKFVNQAANVLSDGEIEQAMSTICGLDSLADVADLMSQVSGRR